MKRSGPIKRGKPLRRRKPKAEVERPSVVIMDPALYARVAADQGQPGYSYPHPMAAVPYWRTKPDPRAATTTRTAGTAQAKLPAVLSPTFLAWVRQQPCELPSWADAHSFTPHPGGDAHHVPTTGSNGREIDDCVVACCRVGHGMAHRGTWPAAEVEAAAHRTLVRFRRQAPLAVQQQVAAEILASLGGAG